jgi:hypothetical protein
MTEDVTVLRRAAQQLVCVGRRGHSPEEGHAAGGAGGGLVPAGGSIRGGQSRGVNKGGAASGDARKRGRRRGGGAGSWRSKHAWSAGGVQGGVVQGGGGGRAGGAGGAAARSRRAAIALRVPGFGKDLVGGRRHHIKDGEAHAPSQLIERCEDLPETVIDVELDLHHDQHARQQVEDWQRDRWRGGRVCGGWVGAKGWGSEATVCGIVAY